MLLLAEGIPFEIAFTYCKTGAPSGVAIDSGTGQISGQIDGSALSGGPNGDGVHFVTVTASRLGSSDVQVSFSWVISNLSCTWNDLADANFNRFQTRNELVDDKIYVMGGWLVGINDNTHLDVYDITNDSWTIGPDLLLAVTHMGSVAIGDEVWLIGGFFGDGLTEKVQIYNTQTQTWSFGPDLPKAIGSGMSTLNGSKIHFVGGLEPDKETDIGDHYIYDLNNPGAGWVSAAPLPTPRNHLAVETVNGLVYAIGGQLGHDVTKLDVSVVEVYDPATDSWSQLADLPTARSHFEPGTAVHNGKILVVGGQEETTNFSNEVSEYDPVTNQWELLCNLPNNRMAPVAHVYEDILIVSGGGINGTNNLIPTTQWIQLEPVIPQHPAIAVDPIADQAHLVDELILPIQVVASGGNPNAAFVYSMNGQPAGISIDPITGEISGTIESGATQGGVDGVYQVSVTVSKSETIPTTVNFQWTITGPLSVVAITDQTDQVGSSISLFAQGSGGDTNEALVYSAQGLPAGLSMDANTGEISGTIEASAVNGGLNGDGVHGVSVTVSRLGSADVSTNFSWTVSEAPEGDLPWVENFDELANGLVADNGITAWTTTSDFGAWEVSNGKLELKAGPSGSLAFFNSEVLDISNYSGVSISVEASDLNQDNKENNDYLKLYYVLDGGQQVAFGEVINDVGQQTFTINNLNGSSLQLILETKVSVDTETYIIDSITIDGTSNLPVFVTGVSVNPPSATAILGGTSVNLTATVLPLDADDPSVTWMSSNPSVASVDNNGVVTALSIGTVVITATTTDGGFTATSSIMVEEPTPVAVTGVSVSPTTGSIIIGGLINMTATVFPADATDPSVIWSSSDNAIATVTQTGVLTGIALGAAEITATTTDGNFTSSIVINVEEAPEGDLPWVENFDELANGLVADNGITAWTTTSDFGAWEVSNGKLELKAGPSGSLAFFNSEVLDISNYSGVSISVEASDLNQDNKENNDYLKLYYVLDGGQQVAFGEVINDVGQQTFTINNLNGSSLQLILETKVSVDTETYIIDSITIDGTSNLPVFVTGVSVNPPSATAILGGTSVNLTATVLPLDADDPSVTWMSSNPSVASVDNNGVVTALSIGTVVITATTTDGGFTATSSIMVEEPTPVAVTGVSVSPTTGSIIIGGLINMTATVFPADATDPSVIWSSSDNAIATVTQTGVLTGIALGAAEITATTTDGNFTSSIVINVEEAPEGDLPWVENFDELANGLVADNGITAWTTEIDQGVLEVSNGKLELKSLEGGSLAFFRTEVLDISNYNSVNFSIEVSDDATNQKENNDYIKLYYVIDGGNPVEFGNIINDLTTPTATFGFELPPGEYSTLQLVAEMKVSWFNETYILDNISIIGDPATPVAVTGVSVSPESASLTAGGATLALSANVLPVNANNKAVTWISNDPVTASVDQNGVVTAQSTGTAIITAITEDGNFSDTSEITVFQIPIGDIPWAESFDELSDGATSDSGSTSWSTASDFGTWEVANGTLELKAGPGGSLAFFNSEVLDISNYSDVSISLLVSDMGQDNKENSDYLKAYYILNGGPQIQFGALINDVGQQGLSVSNINGTSLQLILETKVSIDTETYIVDNILISGTPNVNLSVYGNLTELPRKYGVRIYPNPTHNKIEIQVNPNKSIKQVTLYDTAGRRVRMFKNNVNFISSNQISLDLTGLEAGIFTMYVETVDGTRINKRIIKVD